MRMAAMAVRGLGAVALVLGLALWDGSGGGLAGIHMLVGIALVLALWAVALGALRSGAGPALVVVAFAWGVLVVVLGLMQRSLLVGDGHIVIQLAHLVVGLVAIGLGEMLVASSRRANRPA